MVELELLRQRFYKGGRKNASLCSGIGRDSIKEIRQKCLPRKMGALDPFT